MNEYNDKNKMGYLKIDAFIIMALVKLNLKENINF
jgi:hypothetical protein